MIGSTIGRIRVEALLGEGGMGAVYRGWDELLERPVALKTLPPEHLQRAELWARFLREARLLSRLRHPNVCGLYDLIQGQGADFLVLEYVDGRTLRAIPPGELGRDQQLALAEQVAEALAAAHRERIVHRDLKPENVMLTREGQVKVLDFGVARSLSGPAPRRPAAGGSEAPLAAALDLDRTSAELEAALPDDGGAAVLTRAGAVLGTLRYMSPEQAAGAEVTEASDLFSLGLLLQELFCGRPAYGEETLRGTSEEVLARLRQGRTRPALGLDADLARLVEQLKSLDPAGRPPAAEVAARLRELRRRPERARLRRRRLLAVAGAAALALAALGLWQARRPHALVGGRAARVAVLPFVNATGSDANDWVRLGLRSMVAGALARGGHVAVLDEERVARLAGGLDAGADPERLRRVAGALGADLVVSAVARGSGGAWTFDSITVTADGSVGRHELRGRDLLELGNGLAARVSQRLDPETAAGDLRDVYSSDPLLNRLYAIGVERLQGGGARAARPYFDVCLDRQPDFPRARLQLGDVEEKLGGWQRAQQLYLETARQAGQRGDGPLEALAQDRLAALETHQGRYAEATAHSRAALAIQRRLGDLGGVARSSFLIGYRAYVQGRADEARALLDEALALARQAGDRAGEAEVLRTRGLVDLNSGAVDPAEQRFQGSLQIATGIGDVEQAAKAQVNLALVDKLRGRYAAARARLEPALAVFRERGDRRAELAVLTNLSSILLDLGEFQAAEAACREVLPLARELGDKASQAASLVNLGFFEARRGLLAEAHQHFAEGLALGTWVRDNPMTLFVEARIEYESGRYARAAALLRDLKARFAQTWEAQNDRLLERYEEAARRGRRVPLPPPER